MAEPTGIQATIVPGQTQDCGCGCGGEQGNTANGDCGCGCGGGQCGSVQHELRLVDSNQLAEARRQAATKICECGLFNHAE